MNMLSYKDYISVLSREQLVDEVKAYSSAYSRNPKDKAVIANGLILMGFVLTKFIDPEILTLCKNFEAKLKASAA